MLETEQETETMDRMETTEMVRVMDRAVGTETATTGTRTAEQGLLGDRERLLVLSVARGDDGRARLGLRVC